MVLVSPRLSAEKHEPASAENKPMPAPSRTVELDSLGYRIPSRFYLLARYSSSSLDFIDSTHLLLTFRVAGLLKRLPNCPPDDEDQLIRALVIDLTEGKVVNSAEWRMHDRGRYLWRLRDGRFLVRQRDSLMVTDQKLELQPFLESSTPIDLIELSPDARLLLVENDIEQSDENRRKLTLDGNIEPARPIREGVRLTMIRVGDKSIVAQSEARVPVNMPVMTDGFLETLSGQKDHWLIRYVPFHGNPAVIADVPSACRPNESLLNARTAFIITCTNGSSDHLAQVTSIDGRRLWEYRWQANYIWPTFTASEDGSRVAFSTLRTTHAMNALDPIDDTDISGQRVQVFDIENGNVPMVGFAAPIQGAGQNYALSPDGRRFAIWRDHAIAIYDLPPVTPQATVAASR